MNFVQAISPGFSNYVNFSDRAIRSEYWYWVLFLVLAIVVAEIIDGVLGFAVITPIVALLTLLPTLRSRYVDCTTWTAPAGGCFSISSRSSAASC
jgi:Protein of unknown function (DUF805)